MAASLPFILASGSPRRRELLDELGIEYRVVLPDVDESQNPGESPADCVRRLSRLKAHHVAAQLGIPALILAADTLMSFTREDGNEVILSKPLDDEHARQVLRYLRTHPHQTYSGVSLLRTGEHPAQITRVVLTIVYMRDYTDQEIEEYIATGGPLDKAGGYAIQDKVFHPVDRIEGSYSNVVGLPVEALSEMLAEINYPLASLQKELPA